MFLQTNESLGIEWTLTHGFFMGMGGFMLENHGAPVFPLVFDLGPSSDDDSMERITPEKFDFDNFYAAEKIEVRDEKFDYTTMRRSISKGEILDRSKGDWLAKTIVLIQLVWFLAQVIARGASGLPIATLEITTVAYIAVSAVLYILWWHKPKDIHNPIGIQLAKGYENLAPNFKLEPPREYMRSGEYIFAEIANFLVSVSSWNAGPRTYQSSARVPTFYSGPLGLTSTLKGEEVFSLVHFREAWIAGATELGLALVFGSIHCIAWNFDFHTRIEKDLWRTAALMIVCAPICIALCSIALVYFLLYQDYHRIARTVTRNLFKVKFEGRNTLHRFDWRMVILSILFPISLTGIIVCFGLYFLARLSLLTLAFTSLRNLPEGSLQTVHWTEFFPHFN
jgi:hypothetical protein